MNIIKIILDKMSRVKLVSVICLIFVICYVYSHFMLLEETKTLTSYLFDSNLPEYKTKFIKQKIAVNSNAIASEKGMMSGFISAVFFSGASAMASSNKKD